MFNTSSTQKLVNPENLPVIAGVEITTDSVGRFKLNALQRASGAGKEKAPNEWLILKQTKELIAELEANLLKNTQTGDFRSAQKTVCVVNGGTFPGTFAHELLAVEYAWWISPAFRLQVNQTFIDYRTGKLAASNNPLPNFDDPNALLLGMQSVRLATSANSKVISPMALLLCSFANNSTV